MKCARKSFTVSFGAVVRDGHIAVHQEDITTLTAAWHAQATYGPNQRHRWASKSISKRRYGKPTLKKKTGELKISVRIYFIMLHIQNFLIILIKIYFLRFRIYFYDPIYFLFSLQHSNNAKTIQSIIMSVMCFLKLI